VPCKANLSGKTPCRADTSRRSFAKTEAGRRQKWGQESSLAGCPGSSQARHGIAQRRRISLGDEQLNAETQSRGEEIESAIGAAYL
jgi:hypothetical protein